MEEDQRRRPLLGSGPRGTFGGMRILVIGATGIIGSAVAEALEARGHEVLAAGSSSGPLRVDLSDPASVQALYADAGRLDAVVCAAGVARFGSVDELDAEDFAASARNKLLGQIEVVRQGLGVVREGGSFTLTSGDLSTDPAPGTAAVVATGIAVEGFARAAALDLEGRWRVNVVSPGPVAESLEASGGDPADGIRAADVAAYYVASVEGQESGAVLDARRPMRRRR